MAYCTVADVNEYLGIRTDNDMNLISLFIDAAQDTIDNYCKRTFEGTPTSRYINATGDHIRGNTLYFEEVGELASVVSVTNGDGTVITAYKPMPINTPPYQALCLLSSSGQSWTYIDDPEGAITVNGVWAYSASAPSAIRTACTALAAFYYRQKDQPYADVTAVSQGVVMKPTGIPSFITQMLKGYVKP